MTKKLNRKEIGVIVLAAGKGKRMDSKKINKVAMQLGNKPMILHTVDLLKNVKFGAIVVVVGFAKHSVRELLGNKVFFAEQTKRLGTAHAVGRGLKVMPEFIKEIVVLNGDDSAFYSKEIIEKLISEHSQNGCDLSLLTIEKDNPIGLGRIVRNKDGCVASIVEEKDATAKQRKINEINPGCYIFKRDFLRRYLKKVKKSEITKEYYLTSLVDIAIKNKEKVGTVKMGEIPWRGVNTKDELSEAELLFLGLADSNSN